MKTLRYAVSSYRICYRTEYAIEYAIEMIDTLKLNWCRIYFLNIYTQKLIINFTKNYKKGK